MPLISLAPGCGTQSDYLSFSGATMGTYYRITARCPNVDPDALGRQLTAELDAVNAQMSTYDPDSELSRFNSAAANTTMAVSAELIDVVAAARRISELSGGAFDVTVGPLVNLWGFGPTSAIDHAPAPEQVARAMARVGYRLLSYDGTAGTLSKTAPLYVDLSAIAKGHGVDRLSDRLSMSGCTDHLVDIGGEVRARGNNPTGEPWRIGIEVPDAGSMGRVQRVVALENEAIATSGDYRNYLEFDGERFSHTIDPRTGYPVQHLLASVSVLHPSAMWADGMATALNVLGPDAGLALADREGLAALFLIRTAAGFEERYTDPMKSRLETLK